MVNWLIIDTRDGGLDGYYVSREDALYIAENWKRDLGHDDVMVVAVEENKRRIGKCFLAEKRMKAMYAEANAKRVERN
jgi:hypothetical protein